MLQSYAVSVVSEDVDGALQHVLLVIEASSLDAAEGRVLAQSVKAGRRVKGLLSRSCELPGQRVLAISN